MRMTQIGTLEVSVVGLGCNNFGRALDVEQSALVVDAALAAGMNFFDTASNYGSGQSESFLGLALAGRRSEAVIATKFGMPVPGVDESGGAKPEYVRESTERSLTELGTDYIDLLQLHNPDPDTPIVETLGAMNGLVEAGKVIEIGCSNFTAAQLEEALDASTEHGWPLFVSNQVQFSLIHRQPQNDGLSEVCVERNVALLPFYPLANGLLTGKTRRGGAPQGRLAMDRYQKYLTDENFDLAEAIETYATERSVSMVQVALGWLIAQEAVPSVTPGATKSEQIVSNASAAEWVPTVDDLEALAAILS